MQILVGQALDKASPAVPTLEQIKSAVDATANGWDMPTTIAALESSASNHVSLQCQKCNVSIAVDVVCQHSYLQTTTESYEHKLSLLCLLWMLHHLMPLQNGNSDALPTRMIQHPDQLVSLK